MKYFAPFPELCQEPGEYVGVNHGVATGAKAVGLFVTTVPIEAKKKMFEGSGDTFMVPNGDVKVEALVYNLKREFNTSTTV